MLVANSSKPCEGLITLGGKSLSLCYKGKLGTSQLEHIEIFDCLTLNSYPMTSYRTLYNTEM